MNTGIRPKTVNKGKQFDEHSRRYIFYPLSNLDLASTQAQSPIWNPKISRASIHLLESFEYMTQVANEGESMAGSSGVRLGERTMGTDAQVKYLMGSSDGSGGWMDKGMTYLESMTNIDYETAEEIQKLIFPKAIPSNLLGLRDLLSKELKNNNPVAELANNVRMEMLAGVNKSINYCMDLCGQLEKEVFDGKSGRAGIKYISATNKYYFDQIERALPDDKAGVNMGNSLADALKGIFVSPSVANDVEKSEMQKKIEELERITREQAEVIEAQNESK